MFTRTIPSAGGPRSTRALLSSKEGLSTSLPETLGALAIGVIVLGGIGFGIGAGYNYGQDSEAKSTLDTVKSAQALYQSENAGFGDMTQLTTGPSAALAAGDADNLEITASASNYCAVATSGSTSGTVYWITGDGNKINEGTPGITADGLECPGVLTDQSEFTWTTAGGKATVTGLRAGVTLKSIAIPSKYTNGGTTYPVTNIGSSAFQSDQLTSVRIPGSVTSIGSQAFFTNNLASVTIPDSVTSIGSLAFGANQLTSAAIPDSVTSIAGGLFRNNKLTSVTIPDSVTTIGNSAFQDNLLTSVAIPASVTFLDSFAFDNNKLTSVAMLDSMTSIGAYAFRNNQLTSVTIPGSVTTIHLLAFWNNPLTKVTMLGNAPTGGTSMFGTTPGLKVHYFGTGYSNPWYGYATVAG